MTKKYHLYFDDTGSRDPDHKPRERQDQMDCFGLGGVMIREEDIGTVVARHKEFCDEQGIDYPLHSSRIRGAQGKFGWLKKPGKAELFLPALEEWLLSLPIVGIACVIHRLGYVERYEDLYKGQLWFMCKTAYSILLERAAKFAKRDGRKVEVYFERAGKNEDRAIVNYTKELKADGPPFAATTSGAYKPFASNDFRCFVLGQPRCLTKANPMIQIADLVLYPIAKGGYNPEYRPYVKLMDGGKLIDSCLNEEERNRIGIKYSCFDGLKKK